MSRCFNSVRIQSRAALLAVGLFVLSLAGVNGATAQDVTQEAAPLRIAQQSDNPFAALVGKRSPRANESTQAGAVERYVLASDARIFLFEEYSGGARVQFLCAPDDQRIECVLDIDGPTPEIHLLTATRGPRGDVIYKTAEGETMLRIAAYGGATVFWPGEQQGVAASKSFGDDRPLTLVYEDYDVAMRRAQGAAARLSAVTGAPLYFDVSAGRRSSSGNVAVLADSVVTAAKGLASVADDSTGARIIAERIKRVAFLPGDAPGVSLNGAVLEIYYVPNQDINGRPSSTKIAHYLEETL